MNRPKLPQPSPEDDSGSNPASSGAYSSRVPLVQAAAAQGAAFLVVLLLLVLVPGAANGRDDVIAWAALQGCVAVLLGRALGMEPWWFPMHALFVPGLVWMLGLGLPPLYPLAAFFLLASVYWGVSRSRVPLFSSSLAAARAVAQLLPRDHGFKFVDLGSGLGGMLDRLVRARPQGRYCGIEAAPLPFLVSWLRAAASARPCQLVWGDFRRIDLGRYDVVYAYLSPAAMTGLWNKARLEMRAGSLLISNSFAVPGVAPAYTIATGASDGARLLIWKM